MCYPDNLSVRFTYRRKYFADDLLQKHRSIKNSRALLLFCDIPDGSSTTDFLFVPLRFARIDSFEALNNDSIESVLKRNDQEAYISVKFTLERFVQFGGQEDTLLMWQQWILERLNKAKRIPRPVGHPDFPNTALVFSNHTPTEDRFVSESRDWLALANRLSLADTLRTATLFRVVGIYKGLSGTESVEITDYNNRKAHVLKSGKPYRMYLQFLIPPDRAGPPKSLAATVGSQLLFASKPLLENIGSNTNAEILITSNRSYLTEVVPLVIEDADEEEAWSARADFMIILKPPSWAFLLVLVLGLGLIISSITPDIIKQAAVDPGWKDNADLIALSIRALSSIVVLAIGFFAFRKIPG
jgi:hypothetical protein